MTSDTKTETAQPSPLKSTSPKSKEEMQKLLTEEQKQRINQTIGFIEKACEQWDSVKAKGRKIEDFIQIFAYTMVEYDKLMADGVITPARAKFLTMVGIRDQLTVLALRDSGYDIKIEEQ